ncbi:MAG TPA: type II toxin-antitoxin system PemK/MazF family toxin [Pirellulales bacterium]|jgi:mRNA interferase MazF|nr:type II toxin-antitoxin system PemK/MazF family toxin [Pirellulales bacterium]
MKRGDVVIVDFPFTSGAQSKIRPALVVQNDRDNRKLSKTIVVMITGNLRRKGESTHMLVDPGDPAAASSGLHGPSLVSCVNVYTIDQASVKQIIGNLSQAAMKSVDVCLREALGV